MDIFTRLNKIQNIFIADLFQTSLWDIIINLLLAAFLGFLIAYFYIKHGRALSNRRSLAGNFVLLAMTVAFIITIVRSSLALSLGLVGALSIVRFRSAIKEPEELAYLFFVISIGLGLGANQRLLTSVAVVLILLMIKLKLAFDKKNGFFEQNLFFSITTPLSSKLTFERAENIFKEYCPQYRLKRIDETDSEREMLFVIEFKGHDALYQICELLKSEDANAKVAFHDLRSGLDII